jgi:hypothetical protein
VIENLPVSLLADSIVSVSAVAMMMLEALKLDR